MPASKRVATEIIHVQSTKRKGGGFITRVRLASADIVEGNMSSFTFSTALQQELDTRIAQIKVEAPSRRQPQTQWKQNARQDLTYRQREQAQRYNRSAKGTSTVSNLPAPDPVAVPP